MEWIKCSDRMPDDNQGCIFYCPNPKTGGIDGGWFDKRQDCFLSGSGACGWKSEQVTHWIPFPEPPKET